MKGINTIKRYVYSSVEDHRVALYGANLKWIVTLTNDENLSIVIRSAILADRRGGCDYILHRNECGRQCVHDIYR